MALPSLPAWPAYSASPSRGIAAHHFAVAAEAVAGEEHDFAPIFRCCHPVYGFLASSRGLGLPATARAPAPARSPGCRLLRPRGEPAHQRGPGALRHGMHAQRAVTRIEEPLEHFERDAVPVRERVQGRADGLRDAATTCGRRRAVVFALYVGEEFFDGIVDAPARWKRVPAAGMNPKDSAVEPEGTASRSSTTQSTPASFSISAAMRPQAPAPTTATCTFGASPAIRAATITRAACYPSGPQAVGRNRYSPLGLPTMLPSW